MGGEHSFKDGTKACVCTASVLMHVQPERRDSCCTWCRITSARRSTPPAPEMRCQSFRRNLATSCGNLVILGVSEVEQHSPRGVRIQHVSHPPSLRMSQTDQAPSPPDPSPMSEPFNPSSPNLQPGTVLCHVPKCQSASC